jgi:hypothetical protein
MLNIKYAQCLTSCPNDNMGFDYAYLSEKISHVVCVLYLFMLVLCYNSTKGKSHNNAIV